MYKNDERCILRSFESVMHCAVGERDEVVGVAFGL